MADSTAQNIPPRSETRAFSLNFSFVSAFYLAVRCCVGRPGEQAASLLSHLSRGDEQKIPLCGHISTSQKAPS